MEGQTGLMYEIIAAAERIIYYLILTGHQLIMSQLTDFDNRLLIQVWNVCKLCADDIKFSHLIELDLSFKRVELNRR